jgi:hypothetical protein
VKADGNCKSLDSTPKCAGSFAGMKVGITPGFHFSRLLPRCIDSKFKFLTVQSDNTLCF